jgi:predicted metal-dependent phosphoesterase TrpH
MNADLHCHSNVSDGTLTPEALAARAKANGVELWALTDHDEVRGQQRARDAARAAGLAYVTGTEISVTFIDVTVHIVGLGFDANDAALVAGLAADAPNAPVKWPPVSPGSASRARTKGHSSSSATPT